MPKLREKAIRYRRMDGQTDGRTGPNYRKASLLKKKEREKENTIDR